MEGRKERGLLSVDVKQRDGELEKIHFIKSTASTSSEFGISLRMYSIRMGARKENKIALTKRKKVRLSRAEGERPDLDSTFPSSPSFQPPPRF